MSAGQVLAGSFTMLFGLGYFFDVHSLSFFLIVQILAGICQSTGWTSVVTCMGNWYGKGKRGFIMGVWNAHTSVGNIIGLFLAGAFVDYEWGLSFIVPGLVIFVNGVLTFLFLVPEPTDIGCNSPDQIGRKRSSPSESSTLSERDRSADIKNPMKAFTISTDKTENTFKESHKSSSSLKKEKPVSFIGALKIPGVIEFSMCLFFSKLVSYTFLFWLPKYISSITTYSPSKSAFISVLFDVGGIFGGITAGIISDVTGMSALTCFGYLLLTGPILQIYKLYGHQTLAASIGLSFLSGFFVNGPYALITTAVSADLGTKQVLKDNTKALATVSAIIDGTGSIGAAIGPLLAGVIVESYGWSNVFYVLIGSIICAMLFLLRLLINEIKDSDLWNAIRTRNKPEEPNVIDTRL
ncbi:hypothetical protein FSP39_004636 [Pinctada imbricata]|uniref:Sugar phosphate exchanger 3 n=1 Tax=Pinctada imbricata TaxID=66713 RepID=A0AA89C5H1_PINIB|nr:hypothetical protein FSP39_004636 [Pinctada imbricata]